MAEKKWVVKNRRAAGAMLRTHSFHFSLFFPCLLRYPGTGKQDIISTGNRKNILFKAGKQKTITPLSAPPVPGKELAKGYQKCHRDYRALFQSSLFQNRRRLLLSRAAIYFDPITIRVLEKDLFNPVCPDVYLMFCSRPIRIGNIHFIEPLSKCIKLRSC
jgi:hypothetical protein